MIADSQSIDSILLSLESTLKIEYDEKETKRTLDAAISRLENVYGIRIDKDIYTLQAENRLVEGYIDTFLVQITECLKAMSFYIDTTMYMKNMCVSLADVNYLGLSKLELVTALKYFQDKKLYEERDIIVPVLTAAVTNIDMCTIKRLFIVLLLLERLGIPEGVCVIARFLYLGGI